MNLLYSTCANLLPRNKCYIYDYGVDFEELSEDLAFLDITLEKSDVPQYCRPAVRAYTCNSVYPGCNPLNQQPQGICEKDCVSITKGEECKKYFRDYAMIAKIGGFPFELQCNFTLKFLETSFHQEFEYNRTDCWRISGKLLRISM